MRTFAQKPRVTQQGKFAKSVIPGWAHLDQNDKLNPIFQFGYNFSRIPAGPPGTGAFQAKLVHNKPGVDHFMQRFSAMIPRTNPLTFHDDGALEEEPLTEGAAAESETPQEEPATEAESPTVETAAQEPNEGETVRLPNIEPPEGAAFTIEQADPVNPTLYYTPHMEQLAEANACPKGDSGLPLAGLTKATLPSVINITVTPVLGWYFVDATLDQKITYQICDGVGPQGQVDITSKDDPDITKENYWEVAQDLTPNSKGFPPRKLYYASDLTLIHERFHANEWLKTAQASVPDAQKWLMGKTASSADLGVASLLVDLSKKFMKIVGDKVVPGSEDRAYGDGKALYLARSKAIIAKGDAGEYPKWDWKKGLP